jgi:hypothetical protein
MAVAIGELLPATALSTAKGAKPQLGFATHLRFRMRNLPVAARVSQAQGQWGE